MSACFRKFTVIHADTLRVATKDAFAVVLKRNEWKRIPEKYWRVMYAAGAISEEMMATDVKKVEDVVDQANARRIAIKEEMKRIRIANDSSMLNNQGKPNTFDLNRTLGLADDRAVSAKERDEIWKEVRNEIEV